VRRWQGPLRRVIGRERGITTMLEGSHGLPERSYESGTDILECYHNVPWWPSRGERPRRVCSECGRTGPPCDCGMCRQQRGER